MPLETFALINALGQVVNHIVIDKDNENFESNMADQLAVFECTRYVETTEEQPVIILDESPEIWTTHCDNPDCEKTGFNLPEQKIIVEPIVDSSNDPIETVVIKGRTYPADSMLIKENASRRPAGWSFPEGVVEVTLADKD